MNKLYVVIAISLAASAVFVFLPDVLEHASHYIHWITLVVSGHHIADEVFHVLPAKKTAQS